MTRIMPCGKRLTNRLKHPRETIHPLKMPDGEWARDDDKKADVFSKYLEKVFWPFPRIVPPANKDQSHKLLEAPHQLDLSSKKFKVKDIQGVIRTELKPKKHQVMA